MRNSQAVKILGKDFISPQEIEAAFEMKYTAEQLAMLEATVPGDEVLKWMVANEFMLVAGPPTAMSLLDICVKRPELFYANGNDAWYNASEQKFVRNDKIGTAWLGLRKTIVPRSTSKMWNEQKALLSKKERVPNAAEVTWGVIAYKLARDEFLLPSIYARTNSVSVDDSHVSVGYFSVACLSVVSYWSNPILVTVGLAAALKL